MVGSNPAGFSSRDKAVLGAALVESGNPDDAGALVFDTRPAMPTVHAQAHSLLLNPRLDRCRGADVVGTATQFKATVLT